MGYIKRQKSGTYNAGTRSKVSGQGVQTVKLPANDKKPSK